MRRENKINTKSWEKSSNWYGNIVGYEGHFYHREVILPTVINLLELTPESVILDLGCGQGVLARIINPSVEYWGLDASSSLLKMAKQLDKNSKHKYVHADATKKLPLSAGYFSHAAVILALQNIEDTEKVFNSLSACLKQDGKLVLVLNHPCFRIPRQSGWDLDLSQKQQRRWVNRYMSPMNIPITMHPGQSQSEITWSYHRPLSYYVKTLREVGFAIETIEELVSTKESVGNHKHMENRSRSEIPLFMAIKAFKRT